MISPSSSSSGPDFGADFMTCGAKALEVLTGFGAPKDVAFGVLLEAVAVAFGRGFGGGEVAAGAALSSTFGEASASGVLGSVDTSSESLDAFAAGEAASSFSSSSSTIGGMSASTRVIFSSCTTSDPKAPAPTSGFTSAFTSGSGFVSAGGGAVPGSATADLLA